MERAHGAQDAGWPRVTRAGKFPELDYPSRLHSVGSSQVVRLVMEDVIARLGVVIFSPSQVRTAHRLSTAGGSSVHPHPAIPGAWRHLSNWATWGIHSGSLETPGKLTALGLLCAEALPRSQEI